MPSRVSFLSSTVWTKVLIAITGLAMFVFLIAHMAANLLLFVGPEAYNGYSHKLITNPAIYVAEAGLAALLAIHVFKALTNWARNRSARPAAYEKKTWAGHTSRKTVASSTMIYTGVVIFVFLLLHLKTFKFGPWYDTVHGGETMRDLYTLVIEIFRDPVYVVGYTVVMGLVLLHLRHGVSSAFQSLGVNHPVYNRLILGAGYAFAVLLGIGFALPPIWIFLTK
jgi:succinate dehydrogenase / fumarate reductase cytochrome b subunit